ncbi:hypothetical protein BT96DRAFT_1027459 [Gymnopus androsaceus JB14]|uniref:Uncharacterized protein n=1 Tax=Gymnopus androsaceus JB14 TaxID=1447944 RepID=A0A6A4GBS0_9AGAR|nr:hypothetical protein BT96DRAFT_1027459 [Gymnopus androsaceus JB14]
MPKRVAPDTKTCQCGDDLSPYFKVRLVGWGPNDVRRFKEYSEVAQKEISKLRARNEFLESEIGKYQCRSENSSSSNVLMSNSISMQESFANSQTGLLDNQKEFLNIPQGVSTGGPTSSFPEESNRLNVSADGMTGNEGTVDTFQTTEPGKVNVPTGSNVVSDTMMGQESTQPTHANFKTTQVLINQPISGVSMPTPLSSPTAETTHSKSSLTELAIPIFQTQPLSLPEAATKSDWFPLAFSFVNISLGPEYGAFVQLWTSYELATLDAPKTKGLKANFRPPELSKWLQRQRYNTPSNVVVLAAERVRDFGQAVRTYWRTLQPSWRAIAPDGKTLLITKDFGKEWKPLNCHGVNGWLSLITCLKWWGLGLEHFSGDEQEALRNEWLALIADMSWMLGGLYSHSQGKKR